MVSRLTLQGLKGLYFCSQIRYQSYLNLSLNFFCTYVAGSNMFDNIKHWVAIGGAMVMAVCACACAAANAATVPAWRAGVVVGTAGIALIVVAVCVRLLKASAAY